jgi:hypothetical protein
MAMTTLMLERGQDGRAAGFARLQARMAGVDAAARRGETRAAVVVPSRTIDGWREPGPEMQAYEERLLCSLLELRDPALRLTYVTSSPVAPAIVDYYLSFLPRRLRADARRRLTLVAVGDRSRRPLSQKLLDRPWALEQIRRTIAAAATCHLVPYSTTTLERDLAVALDIPMYAADPGLAHFGTKSGCRAVFAQAGVPHPLGVENIWSLAEAVAAIARLRVERPDLVELVMKLNEGVSGNGNAIVDLRGLPTPGRAGETELIGRRVAMMALEADGVSVDAYLAKLAAGGGIVEERITAETLRSPSVQLRIRPTGEVDLLSTHDQILGGPRGQSYLGCRFPAEPSYAPAISRLGRRVGECLAAAGVIGRFAIDFVVARDGGGWRPYAIEINLRKGGTTHPFETLVHLTGGTYDEATAEFRTPSGQLRHYVATDHLESPRLRALGREGVLALAGRRDLRFDQLRRTGVVFHMLSSLDGLGRAGFTAIGSTAHGAQRLADRVEATLRREAGIAAELAAVGLPVDIECSAPGAPALAVGAAG